MSIVGSILERLAGMGVTQVSFSAADPALNLALQNASDKAALLQMQLIWNLPVPYSATNPIAKEAGNILMEGAGRAWLYVEPDGDVRPTQGDQRILGNLLKEEWLKIWKGKA